MQDMGRPWGLACRAGGQDGVRRDSRRSIHSSRHVSLGCHPTCTALAPAPPATAMRRCCSATLARWLPRWPAMPTWTAWRPTKQASATACAKRSWRRRPAGALVASALPRHGHGRAAWCGGMPWQRMPPCHAHSHAMPCLCHDLAVSIWHASCRMPGPWLASRAGAVVYLLSRSATTPWASWPWHGMGLAPVLTSAAASPSSLMQGVLRHCGCLSRRHPHQGRGHFRLGALAAAAAGQSACARRGGSCAAAAGGGPRRGGGGMSASAVARPRMYLYPRPFCVPP